MNLDTLRHPRLLLILGVLFAIVAGTFVSLFVPITGLSAQQLNGPTPSMVYDRNGNPIGTLPGQPQRRVVAFDEIAPVMREAIVAIEDRHFYEEGAVNPIAIVRALVTNLRSGETVQGGSTITQQLAKNAVVGTEPTLWRKLREAYFAVHLAQVYSKDQILTFYLNQIYFGAGAYGIEEAAQTYFGVSANRLTLPQAATLAALVNAPSALDPLVSDPQLRQRHQAAALQRRDLVLDAMVRQGDIDPTQAAAAKRTSFEEMGLRPPGSQAQNASWFLDYVQNELAQLPQGQVVRQLGGFHIETTENAALQRSVESVFSSDAQSSVLAALQDDPQTDASLVLLDAKTGAIRAIYGSYQSDPRTAGFVPAWQGQMAPGSAIKPLSVYAAAIESGAFTPTSRVYAQDGYAIEGAPIHNFNNENPGRFVSLTEAVAQSYNVSAAWVLQQVGLSQGAHYARAFGLPITRADATSIHRLALGDLQKGVSPLQMAAAYTALANQGTRSQPYAITRIVDAQGHLLYQAKPKQQRVIRSTTAYVLTWLLQQVVSTGTASPAASATGVGAWWPVAGKTGTSSPPAAIEADNPQAVRDLWFCGYTPELVGVAWIGKLQPASLPPLTTGSADPAQLLLQVFAQAGRPAADFTRPEGIRIIDGIPMP
ncbi:MAG: penicillin-binding protein [Firmicutes bacterium]|nr:penicillin-binding protein [Bacillota bacterium]